MSDVNLKICLVIDDLDTDTIFDGAGRRIRLPQGSLEEVQNDAVSISALVDAVDTAKDENKKLRRPFTRLRRLLRPLKKEASKFKEAGEFDVGVLSMSEESFDLLMGIIEKPPEGVQFRGAINETLYEIEEFAQTRKSESKVRDIGDAKGE